MTMGLNRKTVASAVGVIILGALGNALWELLRPGLGGAWDVLLNVTTLGIQSLRDQVYADAAKYGLIVNAGGSDAAALFAALFALMFATLPRRAGFTRIMVPMLLFAFVLATMQSLTHREAAGLAREFDAKLGILLPRISPVEAAQFRADFLQVRTQREFTDVINRLDSSLRAQGLPQPRP